MSEKVTLLVCTKCRAVGEASEPRDQRLGARLLREILAAADHDPNAQNINIQGVECFSVCKRPVTVSLEAAGKWTYLYGDFDMGAAPALFAAAKLYAAAPEGLIPWGERPDALKKGVVARIPPKS